MDGSHFDTLTRSLSGASRRGVLATLAVVVTALLGGSLEAEGAPGKRQRHHRQHRRAAGRHRKHRKTKKRHKHRPPTPPVSPGPISTPPPVGCVPHCAANKPCGEDGCGGLCGACAANETCQGGTCHCIPDCTGKRCGPDSCGGTCGAGCTPPETCDNGSCVCISQCEGRECGGDGCGRACSFCSGWACHEIHCDDASGRCVSTPIAGCCDASSTCNDGNPCTTDDCDPSRGLCLHDPRPSGTPCVVAGMQGLCNTSGRWVQCLGDGDCDDGNPCTGNICDQGACQHPPLASGTSCTQSGGSSGVCDLSGQCVQCMSSVDCDTGNPCVIPRCEPNSHTCAYAYQPNYTPCGGTNTCLNGECRPCIAAAGSCQDDRQCCDSYTHTGVCASRTVGFVCNRFDGQPCQTDLQCYGGRCNHTQPDGSGVCGECREEGIVCSNDASCCSNNCPRSTGTCAPPRQ